MAVSQVLISTPHVDLGQRGLWACCQTKFFLAKMKISIDILRFMCVFLCRFPRPYIGLIMIRSIVRPPFVWYGEALWPWLFGFRLQPRDGCPPWHHGDAGAFLIKFGFSPVASSALTQWIGIRENLQETSNVGISWQSSHHEVWDLLLGWLLSKQKHTDCPSHYWLAFGWLQKMMLNAWGGVTP